MEALDLINRLAEYLGLSQASVLEMAVRKPTRAELPPGPATWEPPPATGKRAPKKK